MPYSSTRVANDAVWRLHTGFIVFSYVQMLAFLVAPEAYATMAENFDGEPPHLATRMLGPLELGIMCFYVATWMHKSLEGVWITVYGRLGFVTPFFTYAVLGLGASPIMFGAVVQDLAFSAATVVYLRRCGSSPPLPRLPSVATAREVVSICAVLLLGCISIYDGHAVMLYGDDSNVVDPAARVALAACWGYPGRVSWRATGLVQVIIGTYTIASVAFEAPGWRVASAAALLCVRLGGLLLVRGLPLLTPVEVILIAVAVAFSGDIDAPSHTKFALARARAVRS